MMTAGVSSVLLILMYHRISNTGIPNDVEKFSDHLRYLARHYPLISPGDPLHPRRLSVCLTFDDAYADFYHVVFPLLRELSIPAVLGVPVYYIVETTSQPSQSRLAISPQDAFNPSIYANAAPFCTWQELREMAGTEWVKVASHSFHHPTLTAQDVDLFQEINHSKYVLENQLNQTIDTFIYPYGQMNKLVHAEVKQQYRYIMRVGSALNYNWINKNNLLYRVDADHFWPMQKLWSLGDRAHYFFKFLFNQLRGK
ncbi:MAG: polysaccharide deacetylase family protein [Legionellales bacterium]|nr:polysaccharide deacetylase family protein [Legionellales bacterium]